MQNINKKFSKIEKNIVDMYSTMLDYLHWEYEWLVKHSYSEKNYFRYILHDDRDNTIIITGRPDQITVKVIDQNLEKNEYQLDIHHNTTAGEINQKLINIIYNNLFFDIYGWPDDWDDGIYITTYNYKDIRKFKQRGIAFNKIANETI